MATKKGTVTAAKVAATLTDYPAYVDLALIGITTLAEAQSIRVYSDAALTNELAREIVSVTEMHVKVPSLTTTTEIWVDYDGLRADYGVTDTYGRNAVWTAYARVLHGQSAIDSTGNDTVTNSSVTVNAQKIGDGFDFSGAVGSYTTLSTGLGTFWNNNFTTQYWFRFDVNDNTTGHVLLWPGDRNQQQIVTTTEKLNITSWNGSSAVGYNSLTTLTAGTRYWANFQRTGSTTGKIFLNGVDDTGTGSLNSPNNPAQAFRLGSRQDNTAANLDGQLDEVRMIASVLTTNWITTEYNNQSDVATFWAWTAVGGSSTTKAIPVNAAKVAATLADYPAFVQPSAMTGWGTLTTAEANSIRFYSDSGLTTELAREVVSADEIHVKVPSLTTTTTIYADYDGIRADYGVTDTYGRNAVWSGYVAVWHKGGGTSSTGAHDTTVVNTTAGGYASPYYGSATEYNTTGAISYAAAHADFRAIDTEGGYQFWSKIFTLPTTYEYNFYGGMYGVGNTGNNNNLVLERALGGNNPSYIVRSTFVEATKPTINVWDKMTFTTNATSTDVYKNGVFDTTSATGTVVASGGEFTIGGQASNVTDAFLKGALWQWRLPKFKITANWETTEYNNQSDVSTFWGTVTDAGGAVADNSGYLVWL